MSEAKNIAELFHELTYHRYLLGQAQAQALFLDMTIPEYIALHEIFRSVNADGGGRIYLRDIAENLRMTIPKTSKMIGGLRDRGLVSWSHDSNGSEGTYVSMTEAGTRWMEQQEAFLREYYGRVIGTFGQESMTEMLRLMTRLEAVMEDEWTRMGDGTDEN